VTNALEKGERLPDFGKVPDSYWKKLLRIGLSEFGNEMPSCEIRPYFDQVKNMVGTSLGKTGEMLRIHEYFDRALGHAAIQFKTSVLNLVKVNFFSRLERLCKCVARSTTDESVRKYTLYNAVRRNNAPDGWPNDVLSFVQEVREKLGLKQDQVLYDDTDISVLKRLQFHWWMQQRFELMEERKLRMTPVFDVSRAHIRLDATHLYNISWSCLKMYEAPPHPKAPIKNCYLTPSSSK
jgi:hypothetical protein